MAQSESNKAAVKKYREANKDKTKKDKALYHKNNRLKGLEQSKNWAKNNRDKIKNYELKNRFGITLEQYNQMFEDQQGCCAICGKHQSELKLSLCVDHNHDTGKVRALLCGKCNTGLGLLNEDIKILEQSIKYLKDHE